MTTSTARETVQSWEEALNTRDAARLLHLSDPDIELVGPRGTARGHGVLAEWLGSAGLSLETQRRFSSGDVVVHDQLGFWPDPRTGELTAGRMVHTVYRVRDGQVTFVSRHDDLGSALAQAGLTEADAV